METENILFQMVKIILVNFQKVFLMGKEYINIIMVIYTMENGKMVKKKEKVCLLLMMVLLLKENFLMVK